MKIDKIYRSLEYIRDEYLEDAADAMEQGRYAGRFRRPRVWVIAAACLALAVVMVALPLLHEYEPGMTEAPAPSTDPVELEEIQLSAYDIAALFDYSMLESEGETKRYTTVTIDNPDDFDMPDSEYLPIYQYDPTGMPIDLNEYKEVTELRKKRLMEAMGVIENPFHESSDMVQDDIIIGLTDPRLPDLEKEFWGSISTVQRLYSHEIVYCQDYNANQRIHLNGELIEIHQGQSDEEIINSLSDIQEILYSIFDVSFSDVKIIRYYGKDKDVPSWIMIYYYNVADHPSNSISDRPRSDYISLTFDNYDGESQTVLSNDILTRVDIMFNQLRVPATELYGVAGKAKTLSLEKAEEYLTKGYVFGGYHACPICDAEELESMPLVDFTDYDYVDLEYVEDISKRNSEKHYTIPFYAFYKYIGDNDDGEPLYAKTYVPAIEVEGIAEYFSHQS